MLGEFLLFYVCKYLFICIVYLMSKEFSKFSYIFDVFCLQSSGLLWLNIEFQNDSFIQLDFIQYSKDAILLSFTFFFLMKINSNLKHSCSLYNIEFYAGYFQDIFLSLTLTVFKMAYLQIVIFMLILAQSFLSLSNQITNNALQMKKNPDLLQKEECNSMTVVYSDFLLTILKETFSNSAG